MKSAILAAALACALSPAWAVNKCTGPDGKVVFQDAPCAGKGVTLNVKPAAGNATLQPGEKTSNDKVNEVLTGMRNDRRREELEDRILPGKRGALQANRQKCDADLANLQRQQARATNNLAGATWLQSLATEMSALSTRCEVRSRELLAEIDTARQECLALGGCK
jgi:hypothetical protein